MKNFVYEYGDSLYINLTNRCSNACEFCIRNFSDGVGEDNLWLELEPTYEQVIEDLSLYPLKKYKEIVFCGFGEPTYRLSILVQVASYLKRKGFITRLNTNGHCDLINKRNDSAQILAKCIDHINISLNAASKEFYDEICRPLPEFKDKAYPAVLKFIKDCVDAGIDTTCSIVDFIGEEEIEACRKITESLGAKFRERETIHAD